MKKLLITGFDPFGGESVNPAYEAVRLLPDVVAEIKLCKLKVPTEFVRSGAVLRDALAAERPDAVLLQLEIPFEVVCAVCHAADRLGIPAVVDLGPAIRADFSRLGRVEILSPNRTELESATGMPAETDEELPSALQKLYETVPCRYIVLKDGSSGAVLYDGAELTRFPTYDVSPIVDTTGAGDAFTAALTLRYIETGDIRAAIDRGNAAGSLAITKLGAQNGMPDAGALDRLQARGLRA